MLILQRKPGESLQIGDNITISVVAVDSNRVRLAISAPSSIPILRSELIAAAKANQDSAAEESAPEALLQLLEKQLGEAHEQNNNEEVH